MLLSRRNDETDEDDCDDGIDDEDQHLEQVLTHTVTRTHTHTFVHWESGSCTYGLCMWVEFFSTRGWAALLCAGRLVDA